MFKQGILKLTQSVFRRMGLQFVGGQTPMQPSFDPSSSFMNDPLLKEQLITELADIAQKHFANRPNIPASVNINFFDQVRNFFEVYSSRPFKSNTGGSGFHNSFWLFLSARAINPDLVVESGVWKSHTTWLLEQACPKAEVLGFDINLSRREGYQGKAQFFEKDWATYDFKNIDPERSFIFFDCHVNHANPGASNLWVTGEQDITFLKGGYRGKPAERFPDKVSRASILGQLDIHQYSFLFRGQLNVSQK